VVGPTATLPDGRPTVPAPATAATARSGAPGRHRLAWLLLASGLCCLAAAVALTSIGWAAAPPLPHLGVMPRAEATPTRATANRPDGSPPAPTSPAPATSPAAAPIRLALPALAIDAPVVPVGVQPGGGMAIPDDPKVLGWWQGGARTGDRGTVVLAGHVDTAQAGAGALFPLSRAVPGQHVLLTTSQGTRDYVINAVRAYLKADLPSEVFATTGQSRLALITCGGPFDPRTRQYADNLVVYALPA
jgi:Sortase domain